MQFSELSTYLEKLEKTASRNDITIILAAVFKKAGSDEIDKLIYLSLGILAPAFRSIIFNVADQMMIRAIAQAYSIDVEKVKTLYKKQGDLGTVSYQLSKTKTTNLTVLGVYAKLLEVSREEGGGSQERRVAKLAELLQSLDGLSAKFVTRIPLGKLRLGFSELTIVDALSWSEKGDKSAKSQIQKAYEVMPDVGLLAKTIRQQGLEKATKNPTPILGIPVSPMLAQRINSPQVMIQKMGEVSVEPKFDGLRVEIHFNAPSHKGDKLLIKAFTRNLNDITPMFPELTNIGKYLHAEEIILDTEAIGINEKTLQELNFQTTMTRRRKHDIADFASKIPVKFCVFDILYVDGKNLMQQSYLARRDILPKIIKTNPLLQIVDYTLTKDPKVIEKCYSQELSKGLEGIMIKKTDSDYVPGRTGWRWVKMKQEASSEGKLSDTLDCIVMGYTVGQGKRTSFGVGQFLVGIKDGEHIKTVSKVGTGLTDDQFRDLKTRLKKLQVKTMPKEYEVAKLLTPDYWVTPSLVVEIAADDITKSPNHSSGLALRFPRLVKFRDDKSSNEATTLKELLKLYKLQK